MPSTLIVLVILSGSWCGGASATRMNPSSLFFYNQSFTSMDNAIGPTSSSRLFCECASCAFPVLWFILTQWVLENILSCSSLSPWYSDSFSLQAQSTQGSLALYTRVLCPRLCSTHWTILCTSHRCRFGQPSASGPTLFLLWLGKVWKMIVLGPLT